MTITYCDGKPRQAEQVFGWGREAVPSGLNERRTGMRCLENYSARGRRPSEEVHPQRVARIHAMVEPESPADPKFQTPLAYTRITAKAVPDHRAATATETDAPGPAERTVADILKRLG
jgi:hypothetical protein